MQDASAHSVRSRPGVLLLATGKWISTARFAAALSSLGCNVDLMSLKGHPALLTGALDRHFVYKPLRPIQSVSLAIAGSHPDALIPVDEQAVLHLKNWRQRVLMKPFAHCLIVRSAIRKFFRSYGRVWTCWRWLGSRASPSRTLSLSRQQRTLPRPSSAWEHHWCSRQTPQPAAREFA